MIIQCTECQTRFKLADDKMKPAGVRVRCTHCNVVFTATPPAPIPTPEPARTPGPIPVAGGKTASGFSDTADFSDLNFDEDQLAAEPPASNETGDQDFDFGEFNMEDLDTPHGSSNEIDATKPDDDSVGDLEASLDVPDFSLEGENLSAQSPVKEVEPGELPPLEEFSLDDDFTGFDDSATEELADTPDFSLEDGLQIGGDLGVTFEDETPDEELPGLDQSALGTQEFSFDDSPDEPLGEVRSSEPIGPVEFSFDSSEDPFAIPEDLPTEQPKPLSSDEFVFEDAAGDTEAKPAEKPVKPEKKPPQPPAKADSPGDRLPASPPHRRARKPKTKRRKKSSGYRSVLLFLFLLMVVGAGYAYFGSQQGTYKPEILIERAKFLIKGSSSEEMTGQIDISDLRSQFVVNQGAGNLFVVHGKATNNYSAARSTISVRGIIYDASGNAILQQTAFCGNPLDDAALRTLPYAKIEETMNNQFGDALSNLNIDSGQSIPFTIVFRNIPAQVTQFNIELADSRPGTK